jgi:guanylate kinase
MKDRRHVVVSGPSGSGKSTLLNRIMSENEEFRFSVSHTTRKMRKGEVEGRDYFFVNKKEFEDKVRNGDFLEYAIYSDHYYGTSHQQLQNDNCILFFDLERQGVLNLKKMEVDFRFVFLYCNKDTLRERLINRLGVGNLTDRCIDEIERRVMEADKDMELYKKGIYDIGIENVDINESYQMLRNFVHRV